VRLTYLIGEPGVGKTTLLNAITEGLPGMAVRRPFARTIYDCGVVQLGESHPVFGGTDKLSMSVQPKVVEWAAMPDYPDIVGEGDRLANAKFFQAMKDLGYDLCIVLCFAPSEVAAERRLMRAAQHTTKPQDAVWLQGRQTKIRNLASEWAAIQIDTTKPAAELLPGAATIPVLETLLEARS
jgi:hypothetical protein